MIYKLIKSDEWNETCEKCCFNKDETVLCHRPLDVEFCDDGYYLEETNESEK